LKQLTAAKKTSVVAPVKGAAAKSVAPKSKGITYSQDPQAAPQRKGDHLIIEAIHKHHQVIQPGIKTVDINVRTPKTLTEGRVHKDSLAFALRQVSGYHKRIQDKIVEVIDELQKAQSKSLTYEKSTYVKDPVLPARKKPAPKPAPKFVDHEKIFDQQIEQYKKDHAQFLSKKKAFIKRRKAARAARKAARKLLKAGQAAPKVWNNVEEYKTSFADTL